MSATLCLALALLVALGVLVGSPVEKSPKGLAQVLHAAIVKPPVTITLAFLLLLLIAWCTRRLRLEWLVWSPGPILVRELTAPPDLDTVQAARLTAVFRERLMKARLESPTTVPGAAPAQDFLAMLEGARLDQKNLFASLVGILRAAIPTHAYEVSVALVRSPGTNDASASGCGVAAQLTRLPREIIPVQTCWAQSWEDTVLRAADEISAVVLPRTRRSRSGTWSGWRRYNMPPLLVPLYERGQERTAQRRYDEALESYFSALELDPKNVAIRLNIGFVQEKLGLFLDAVATYAFAQQIADRTAPSLYAGRARRERRALALIARYRLAILLSGRKVAHQWRNEPSSAVATDRDHQRAALRTRLQPELLSRLPTPDLIDDQNGSSDLLSEPPWTTAAVSTVLGYRAPTNNHPDRGRGYFRLRKVLAHLALHELETVHRDLTPTNTIRTSPTRVSVRLATELVRMRLDWIKSRLGGAPWAADVARVKQALSNAGVKDKSQLGNWDDHYNAACLYAVPLLVHPPADARVGLVRAAVEHLKQAVSCTFSGDVAERRPWLVSEDPDLDGLRLRPEFGHFEAVYFPSATRTLPRPRGVHEWEMSCYAHELLIETARRWHAVWHSRRDQIGRFTEPRSVQEWFADETRAWELVDRLAKHYRHWRSRYEMIEEMERFGSKYGFSRVDVAVVPYAAHMRTYDLEHRIDARLDAVKTMVNTNRRRLESLHAMLDSPRTIAPSHQMQNGSAPSQTAAVSLSDSLRRFHDELNDRTACNRSVRGVHLVALCDAHAGLWQRLAEWLEDNGCSSEERAAKFSGAMQHTLALWGFAYWRLVPALITWRGLQR